MPAPYSTDIRKKVINAIEIDKQSKPDIAKRFAVSYSFVHTLWRHYQETGTIKAKKVGGHVAPKVDEAGGLEIKSWLIKEPDLTLNDLCDRYAEHFDISMGKSSMDRALKRMNLRYKKKSIRS